MSAHIIFLLDFLKRYFSQKLNETQRIEILPGIHHVFQVSISIAIVSPALTKRTFWIISKHFIMLIDRWMSHWNLLEFIVAHCCWLRSIVHWVNIFSVQVAVRSICWGRAWLFTNSIFNWLIRIYVVVFKSTVLSITHFFKMFFGLLFRIFF